MTPHTCVLNGIFSSLPKDKEQNGNKFLNNSEQTAEYPRRPGPFSPYFGFVLLDVYSPGKVPVKRENFTWKLLEPGFGQRGGFCAGDWTEGRLACGERHFAAFVPV